jgi:hypothetical protein
MHSGGQTPRCDGPSRMVCNETVMRYAVPLANM